MQKDVENLEFVQGVHFDSIDSFKNNGTVYLLLFDVSCDEIAIQKHMLISLMLEDIVDWVLFTFSTICFIEANMGET